MWMKRTSGNVAHAATKGTERRPSTAFTQPGRPAAWWVASCRTVNMVKVTSACAGTLASSHHRLTDPSSAARASVVAPAQSASDPSHSATVGQATAGSGMPGSGTPRRTAAASSSLSTRRGAADDSVAVTGPPADGVGTSRR
ncbi:MAG: hypothetical protein K0S40_1068 [Actinomycetospora sp.]|nr:hypothetical protein [Actinomycetospora sp.]